MTVASTVTPTVTSTVTPTVAPTVASTLFKELIWFWTFFAVQATGPGGGRCVAEVGTAPPGPTWPETCEQQVSGIEPASESQGPH